MIEITLELIFECLIRMLARVRKGQDNEISESTPAKPDAASMKHVMTTLKHPGNPLTNRAGLSEVGESFPCSVSTNAGHCYVDA
jgi:hypothetical protein